MSQTSDQTRDVTSCNLVTGKKPVFIKWLLVLLKNGANICTLDAIHGMQKKLVSRVMTEISRDGWGLLFIPVRDN